MEALPQSSAFNPWPYAQFMKSPIQELGGINALLSKSRLVAKVTKIYEKVISLPSEPMELGLLNQLLLEISSFRDQQQSLDLIDIIVRSFFAKFDYNCENVYAAFIEQQLGPFSRCTSANESLLTAAISTFQTLQKIHNDGLLFVSTIEERFPSVGALSYRFTCDFKNLIFQNLKVDLGSITCQFFGMHFSVYQQSVENLLTQMQNFDQEEDEQQVQFQMLMNIDQSAGQVQQMLESQQSQGIACLCDALVSFGWVELLKQAFSTIVREQVAAKLQFVKGNFSQPIVKKLTLYLQVVVLKWIKQVVQKSQGKAVVGSMEDSIMRDLNQAQVAQDMMELKLMLVREMEEKLESELLSKFASLRTSEMFDIFSEFPDSSPCLNDLKYALDQTKLHSMLAHQMKHQFQQRLLIPGVSTLLIIEHYIQAIQVMKLIDPSTILLEIISEPIKDHLRKRQDTLRCIVQSIIAEDSELYDQLGYQYTRIPLKSNKNQSNSDLRNEQLKSQNRALGGKGAESKGLTIDEDPDDDAGYISSDEDEAAAENWEPLPLNKDMIDFFISAKRKKTDIISTLVNIYGSQDAFLKVYKSMLEERLLSGSKFSYDTEIKNLELMKLRFGEQNLHACDVMLKDIKESERLNAGVKKAIEIQRIQAGTKLANAGSQMLELSKLQTCVISKGYWQQVQDDEVSSFKPPPFLKKSFEDFAKHYSQFKRLRTINFRPNLGSVQLTLHFQNGSFKFKVSPLQASIISLFDDAKSKSLSGDAIAKALSIPFDEVKRKIAFWVCKGVLQEHRNFKQIGTSHFRSSALLSNQDVEVVYSSVDVLEVKGEEGGGQDESELLLEGAEEIINIRNSQKEDDKKLMKSFIMNILNNPHGGSTFEKIASMLKTVYMVGENLQADQIKEVLQAMILEEKISFNGQIYSINN